MNAITELFGTLQSALGYAFVWNAVAVSVMIALCAGLLGVPLVLKRYSFIGDGLSHVAFGAVAVATVMHITSPLIVVLPVTVLAALLLLATHENAKLRGDSAIAVLSVSALAVGYLLLHFSEDTANVSGDVCSSLFGSTSLLTLSAGDVGLCFGLSAFVLAVFVLFYHKLFAVTFDETFAHASGIPARLYRVLLAVLSAVVISTAMELVGSLLVSALIVFPALSAMRLFRTFRGVTLCSAAVAVSGALVGMLLSILLSTPAGATIVVTDLFVYLVFTLIDRIRGAR